ncbi:MAG: tryptophan 2,3-dioxygenase [Flavobacteriales bacterium]|nr:MAG: tryptophan 2,3-dioxygenase [Flavobacteriales bacterium]
MEFDPEITERIRKLEAKYGTMGQDMKSYLDGLLYSDPTNYWDYINVDTLLSLQSPLTDFPDEMVFIIYHQVTELYFKLSLHELKQITNNGRNVLTSGEDKGWNEDLNVNYFTEHVKRINSYFEALTKSFDIMVDGMEKDQFLRFRMALLPGSGFQSAQYRMIEICCTDFIRLVTKDAREKFDQQENPSLKELFEYAYWKQGATELASGKKTLTLKLFEKKYTSHLIAFAKKYKDINLWKKYLSLSEEDRKNEGLISALRELDANVNVNWPLMHYKSAVRYLQQKEKDIAATGGTNWQKYLPPRFQKRVFYPELWTAKEIEEWGKKWVEKHVNNT